jgi:hypothetical protein
LDLAETEAKDVEQFDRTIHTRSFLRVLTRWCPHQKLGLRIFSGYAKGAVHRDMLLFLSKTISGSCLDDDKEVDKQGLKRLDLVDKYCNSEDP